MARQAEPKTAGGSEQLALLEELKNLATRLGYDVRQETLMREVGYHVRSGSVRLRDTKVILLDRSLPAGAQIDVLVDELAGRALDDVYLSPVARRLLERPAT